ncbi:conserved hypothetical protein [Ricinus communis]|uniref:Uncharacterized protein n=1 Tax=Ricinus communis TaxID=3988 RepID=B9SE71_RICCO|nr:conserved hypothetical protein [Ricinus communis]
MVGLKYKAYGESGACCGEEKTASYASESKQHAVVDLCAQGVGWKTHTLNMERN